MFNKLKGMVISFLHGQSLEAVVKLIIAWQAKPEVVQALVAFHVPPEWLQHELAVFGGVLWGIDRLHRLYGDFQASKPTPVASVPA